MTDHAVSSEGMHHRRRAKGFGCLSEPLLDSPRGREGEERSSVLSDDDGADGAGEQLQVQQQQPWGLGRLWRGVFDGISNLLRPLCGPLFGVAVKLSPLQEERLREIRARADVPFDGSNLEHQEALRRLWAAAYPGVELEGLKTAQWKQMGWQGTDPGTDFRGGGFLSLEHLIYMAIDRQPVFRRLCDKVNGKRSDWEYPFAVGGLNTTFMLLELLEIKGPGVGRVPSGRPGLCLCRMLNDEDRGGRALEEVYCTAFELLDAEWLRAGASYMEFNAVMETTKKKLAAAMSDPSIHSAEDLRAVLKLDL